MVTSTWNTSRARLAVLIVTAAGGTIVAAEDWPNFRGPGHDGISTETGIRTEWNEPIPFVWDAEVGSAFSSFAVVGNRLYTCGAANEMQTLMCLDADTGKLIWQTDIEAFYRDPQGGDGARATPTVDDGRVYILGASGTLLCVDADTGKPIWKQRFHRAPQWGYSGSVLVDGDLAISTGGGADGALSAFDKKTGRPLWQCGDDPAGYATPYPFTLDGTRYIVGFTGTSAIIAEAAGGRLAARIPWKTSWEVNAASPIFHDGYLFLSSGYRTGCGLFKLASAGSTLMVDDVWESKVFMNKFQSCLLYEGNLYASDQKALVCADFMTGEERWRQHRVKHGTVLIADGQLILLTQDGQLQIGPLSPRGFEPATQADLLSGRCWTVPVLNRGKLYVRNLTRVACFNLGR